MSYQKKLEEPTEPVICLLDLADSIHWKRKASSWELDMEAQDQPLISG